jgi:UTRA domain/Bacterial regulatory proteins, gntR family
VAGSVEVSPVPGGVPAPREARAAAGKSAARPAAAVLADRLAAALVHHEPGWRLPRRTALARRYNVNTTQIDAAIEELVERHLIRRLPDGQLYRVSPAESLIPLAGVPGLVAQVDPMGGELTCRSRQLSWRRVPEDIGWALRVDPAEPVCVLRFLWAVGGEPAAYSTTYLPAALAAQLTGTPNAVPETLAREDQDPGGAASPMEAVSPVGPASPVPAARGTPLTADTLPPAVGALPLPMDQPAPVVPVGTPGALHVEMQLPPPSVARSLRLTSGQPAAMVTVRFDDPRCRRPVALTAAVLRPDLFRIVVQSDGAPLADGRQGSFSGAWTHVLEDWEP